MSQYPHRGDASGSRRDIPGTPQPKDSKSSFLNVLQRRKHYSEKPPTILDDESRSVLEAKTQESERRINQRQVEKKEAKDWADAREYVFWKSFREYMMRDAPRVWRNDDTYQKHDKNITAFEEKMRRNPYLRDIAATAEVERVEAIEEDSRQRQQRRNGSSGSNAVEPLPDYGLPTYGNIND